MPLSRIGLGSVAALGLAGTAWTQGDLRVHGQGHGPRRTVADTGFPLFRFLGRYNDTFVREKGQWLFLRREAYTDVPAPK